MKAIRGILAATGIGLIGYAIYRYYKKQAEFIQQYEYKVVGIKVVTLQKEMVSLDITTKIFNNSNVEAVVKEIYLDIFLNGVKVGNVDEVKDTIVRAKGTSFFSFRFSFNPKVVLGNLLSIATLSLALKDLVIQLKGFVKVKSGFLQVNVPFEYQNNIKSLLNK